MDKDEIKRRVRIEQVLAHYGRQPNAQGVFQCLFPQNHHNGDIHHSGKVSDGRAFCNSQGCLDGKNGMDIFGLVGKMENLSIFPDQKAWIVEQFGPFNGTGKQGSGSIVRVHKWVDAEGRVSFHTRMSGTPKFKWNSKADGSGMGRLAPCKPDYSSGILLCRHNQSLWQQVSEIVTP